jgi:serine/threonine protein kinase
MSAFTQERRRAFVEWEKGERADLLGSGKYGKVFRVSGGSARTVVKECVVRSSRTGMRRQAFREHAIGILQTLLALEGCTPHLPLHFGAWVSVEAGRLHGRMYMEEHDGSLRTLGREVLRRDEDWVCLAFQVTSTLVTLAEALQLTHNDLYPRNVLISRHPPKTVTYRFPAAAYSLEWNFFVALTDFGIASSLLMGCSAPEIAEVLKKTSQPIRNFGSVAPSRHILEYRWLPPFSRDLYTILKWIRFPSTQLPLAPRVVALWAQAMLLHLDTHQASLDAPSGLHCAFSHLFSARSLAGLPGVKCAEGPCDFTFASAATLARVLEDAKHVLYQLPLVPSAFSSATAKTVGVQK